MNLIFNIIIHTPLWVWLLLAYLVWQGFKAMQPRTTTIWRALIVPAIFIVWGMSRIGSSQQATIWPIAAWGFAAVTLVPVGVLTPRSFEVNHAIGQISRPGSVFPLIRNIVVFVLQYSVAVLAAMHADDHAIGAIVGRAVSGATSGYFIGSTIALLREYWRKR
jgi:hypothetical protein